MSAQSLLEQLLKSGMQMMQSGSLPGSNRLPSVPGAQQGRSSLPTAPQGSGLPAGATGGVAGGGADWKQLGIGAVAGSALGLLLGSKRGRGMGGKALKVGSVAALGALAYKAYTSYQANQAAQAAQAPASPAATGATTAAGAGTASTGAPLRMVDRVPEVEVEAHSVAMLKAMVAAAKADGHMDDRERGLLDAELQRLNADPATRQLIDAELRRPLDPADVARSATTPELAAEIYLASLLMVDETNTMERLYLDELARQLKLPEGLKLELERQAG